ncbi:MAG: hypothetical protein NVSMB31_20410 [Vulcanimicrobiaceae bacterium]
MTAQNRIMTYVLRIPTYSKGTIDVPYDSEKAAQEALAKLRAHVEEGAGKYSSRGLPNLDTSKVAGLFSVVSLDDEA